MKLKTVRALQGLQWVGGGWRVFGQQPLGFSALFALVGLSALLLVQVPLAGPVLALGLMPLASAGFLIATREALAGRRVHPGLLLGPLRDPVQRRGLVQLGGVYAVAALAVVLLAHLLDGGRFAAAVEAIANDQATPEMMADPMLEFGVLLRLALMAALSLLFWHAPALVLWHGQSTPKALFGSLLACWRSLGAFFLYALAWFVLLTAFVFVTQLLFSLLGLGGAAGQAALPAVMLFSTVFYASLYFSYADAFDSGDDTPAVADDAPA